MSVPHPDVPAGQVTFFFTDVEGSTSLWERDPEGMEAALAEHDQRLQAAIDRHDGYVFTTAGDSFAVSFPTALGALEAAIEAQRRLREPCAGLTIRVRMGLHSGLASVRDGDYFGAAVNRCARIMSAGHGGQILVSGATAALIETSLPSDVDLVDLGEHRLKDLLRPERIHQVGHPELERRFETLKTLTGPVSNLPTQLNSFIGRDRELRAASSLLREHRIVTLTGPGGAGKTRLSMQVAAEAFESFPDGLRFVEFASITESELAVETLASTLDVSPTPGEELVHKIAERIGRSRMLLVIDNCEHLLETTHEMSQYLLQHCPHLKILATSRQRLGAVGEATFALPPMAVPDSTDASAIKASDAVALFEDRAMLAQPSFRVTDDNVDAVAAICRRLDGIPLALELAAARARVLSPEQIAQRLDERFRLLGTSDRGIVERHRTLEATIAWSYAHLSSHEQAVFRRSCVFAGSFSLDAAEEVCSGGTVDRWDILDLVSGLVDQSMLVPEDGDDTAVRYRLLESMRVYGRSRWDDPENDHADAGVDRQLEDRHADHIVDLGFRLSDTRRAGDVGEAIRGFRADVENVRSALRHLLDSDRTLEAARLTGAIGYLWYATGAFREGVEWCRELFAGDPALGDEVRAAAIHSYSLVLGSRAQPEEGAEMLRRQVEIRRRPGGPARLAAALNNLGNLLTGLGRPDEAPGRLHEAIQQYRLAGEAATLPLVSLAFAAREVGDAETSRRLCSVALEEARRADDAWGRAVAASGLGEALLQLGRTDEGENLIRRSRAELEEIGVAPGVGYCDLLLGVAALEVGDRERAAHHLLDALFDVDRHWYHSTRYWIALLAADAIEDPRDSTRLLGAVSEHDAEAEPGRPAWVAARGVALAERLRVELGEPTFGELVAEGRRTQAGAVVETTERLLRTSIDDRRGRLARPEEPT
ncbi:MAG: adenylate/guanylate cyclase domain-containing protein [Ilumatobacter sp.]